MSDTYIEHGRLLTDNFSQNPLWTGLTDVMDVVINKCIQGAAKELEQIRWPDTHPYFAFLNTRMLGFNIPSLAFTDQQYTVLMRELGKYWQTCGASNTFAKFLSYVLSVRFIYIDLWANSLDMDINDLVQDHGTPLWQGGDWFPTSYFDIVYSVRDYPNVNEDQFRTFIKQLAPKHLVLRQIIGIYASTENLYLTAIPLDRQRTTVIARPL